MARYKGKRRAKKRPAYHMMGAYGRAMMQIEQMRLERQYSKRDIKEGACGK